MGGAQERVQQVAMRALQDPFHVSKCAVPAAFLLCYVPHSAKLCALLLRDGVGGYDNETPRMHPGVVQERGLIHRLAAAHQNGLEMFPGFAFGVLLALQNKADPMRLAQLTAKYLKYRVVYNIVYAVGVNKAIAAVRTVVWCALFNVVLEIYASALAS